MSKMSQETVDTLVAVVQHALESNLDSKTNVKNKDLDRRLWDAMHALEDMDESE